MREKLTIAVDHILKPLSVSATQKPNLPVHWTQSKSLDFSVWTNNYKNFVKLTDLYINYEYQRPLNKMSVLSIAEHFNTIFSTPIIVDRKSMEIIDGQQHAAAAYYRGDIKEIPVVYLDNKLKVDIDDKTYIAMLAKAFISSNSLKRAITPIQAFKSAYAAGDPEIVAIERSLTSGGFCCATNQSIYKHLSSPTILKRLYEAHGGRTFDQIIGALSFFNNMRNLHSFLLNGLGRLQVWIDIWNRTNPKQQFNIKTMVDDACSFTSPDELFTKLVEGIHNSGHSPDAKSVFAANYVARFIQERYNNYAANNKKPVIPTKDLIDVKDK